MPKGIPICKICKEPVWSFFCMDCLAEDVVRILPERIKDKFREFHSSLFQDFTSSDDLSFDYCLKCGVEKENPVCTYCYLNEAMAWLRGKNEKLAEKVRRGLEFAIRKEGFPDFFRNTRMEPITQVWCNPRDDGICDHCGLYSEDLRRLDGKMVCEACRHNY